MSESSDLVNELRRLGVNYQAIGESVGRNRSLIRQVGIGAKPGNNLRDALAELRDRLASLAPGDRTRRAAAAPVQAPARRTTRAGREARTRKPTARSFRGGSVTANIKRQASRSGGRSLNKLLATARDEGMRVAATISFDRTVTVRNYSQTKRGMDGPGGVADWDVTAISEYAGEDASVWLMTDAVDYLFPNGLRGIITGHGDDPTAYVGHINSIELRVF